MARYTISFKEEITYEVTFESALPPEELFEDGMWFDEMDTNQPDWSMKAAVDVQNRELLYWDPAEEETDTEQTP